VLENHPIFGGEAKRNEFNVDGQRLIASQGSAMWFQPLPGSFLAHFYDSVGIDPRQFQYQQNASSIATGVTPYAGDGSNFGLFFKADGAHPDGMWLVDPWTKKLAGAPIAAEAKRELLTMQDTADRSPMPRRHGDEVARRLDTITLEDDLMMRHGLSRETIRRYLSPVSGGGSGIGADVLSAYTDYAPDLLFPWEKQKGPQMFPGGNIAGIILNRWGHAYLAPQPGFFFGKDGKRAPAELMRRHPFGRIAFANSDLSGIMDHRASIMEAHRAVQQVIAVTP
jgi:spermidine dehydrogenase